MSETPKCPYCGAEMKVDAVRLTQHNWVGWSHCENCRSVGPSKSNCYTEKEAEESALSAAIHRAEPEMRPLTLEELKAHCAKGRDAEPLWVEYDTVRDMALWVLANTPCGMDEKEIPSLTYWLKDEELVSEYGKFWRCWPRKPTPEKMEAEKWEE